MSDFSWLNRETWLQIGLAAVVVVVLGAAALLAGVAADADFFAAMGGAVAILSVIVGARLTPTGATAKRTSVG